MQLYRLLVLLAAIALVSAQDAAPAGSDPCLAEDYAEANCARATQTRDEATLADRWCACSRADGTCCAQGGYKKPGHG